MIKASKFKFSISFWIMLYCVLSFTAFKLVPIYFSNPGYGGIYDIIIFLVLMCSVLVQLSKYVSRQGIKNYYWSILGSILVGLFVLIGSAFLILADFLAVWDSGTAIYTKRDNPEVTINSRYINLGAGGGGTSPDDYQIVLHRPLTPLFKMETKVDTNAINKKNWIKTKITY